MSDIVLYHFTDQANKASILKLGLLPHPSRYEEAEGDEGCAVFLTDRRTYPTYEAGVSIRITVRLDRNDKLLVRAKRRTRRTWRYYGTIAPDKIKRVDQLAP